MKDGYFTLEDLVFYVRFPVIEDIGMSVGMHSKIRFANGYAASVGYGGGYYSDGPGSYELMAIKPDGTFYYEDPLCYLTPEELNNEMIELQKIKPKKRKFTPEDPYGEEEWD